MYIRLPPNTKHDGTTINGKPLSGACTVVTEESNDVLSCPLGNPLQPLTHRILTTLKVTPSGRQRFETFTVHFNNTNSNPAATAPQALEMPNTIVKKFTVFSQILTPEKIQYDDTKDILTDDLKIEQKFTVINNGPARIKEATIIADFPRYEP